MEEDLDQESLREEAASLKRLREVIAEQLASRRNPSKLRLDSEDVAQIRVLCQAIAQWLENAAEEQWTLILEALQVRVEATRDNASIHGVLPYERPKFITIEQTSA